MAYSAGRAVLSHAGGIGCAVLCVVALGLGGCASSSADNAGPTPSGPNVVGPQDTGTYPNLNIPMQQAAPQLSDADSKAKLASLAAQGHATQRSVGAPPNPRDSAQLGQLARNHGKDTLKAIGAKCDPTLDPNCK